MKICTLIFKAFSRIYGINFAGYVNRAGEFCSSSRVKRYTKRAMMGGKLKMKIYEEEKKTSKGEPAITHVCQATATVARGRAGRALTELLVSGCIIIYKRLCAKINNAKAPNCQWQLLKCLLLVCCCVVLRQILRIPLISLLPQSGIDSSESPTTVRIQMCVRINKQIKREEHQSGTAPAAPTPLQLAKLLMLAQVLRLQKQQQQ